ncbi:MAG: hypothetical protein ABWK53_05725 [Anaerolineales bacterium]
MQNDPPPVSSSDETPTPQLKRPQTVTLLTLFVLFFSAWNGIRLGQAIILRDLLQTYRARGGFLYPALSGGFWLVISLMIAWGLWRGAARIQKIAAVAAALYALWYWFDRLVIQIPHPGWPFAMGITLVLLAAFYIDLFDPQVSKFIQSKSQR